MMLNYPQPGLYNCFLFKHLYYLVKTVQVLFEQENITKCTLNLFFLGYFWNRVFLPFYFILHRSSKSQKASEILTLTQTFTSWDRAGATAGCCTNAVTSYDLMAEAFGSDGQTCRDKTSWDQPESQAELFNTSSSKPDVCVINVTQQVAERSLQFNFLLLKSWVSIYVFLFILSSVCFSAVGYFKKKLLAVLTIQPLKHFGSFRKWVLSLLLFVTLSLLNI